MYIDNLHNVLQEIYNECVEQRTTAIQHRNKIMKDIDELEDVQMVGKITNDLLKIVDSAIDKKLALAKLQVSLINGGDDENNNATELSPDQMKTMKDLINEAKGGEENK